MKTKTCPKCKKKLPAITEYFHRNKTGKYGLESSCKICKNKTAKKYRSENKEKIQKIHKKWRGTFAGQKSLKRYKLKHLYGLTLDDHLTMYIMQNGRCAICKRPVALDKVYIDHNHQTEKVRGLLCNRCNHFLTAFDDKDFFENTIKYLEINDG